MEGYERICFLARKLGYREFTKLQKKVFENEDTYNFYKWLMVMGATSSGKTLVAMLIYFYSYYLQKEKGKSFRMLFAVPYRALAAQKMTEIAEMVQRMELSLNVIQSTGEFRNDDTEVRNGTADIVVIIYEKIFMFSSMDSAFLKKYDLLVMDEIGLTQDISRGVKADFILARAKNIPSLRVIALATPFFDWENYINMYSFTRLKEDERPVDLVTYPIYYGKTRVNHVEEDCQAVTCIDFPKVNRDGNSINPWRRVDNIIKSICVYHLKQGHKILIFENNRDEVRRLPRRLFYSLQNEGVLHTWMAENECKKYVREQTGIEVEEELYGLMGKEDYQAFGAGIGYHNANIPAQLRSLVEKEFLQRDGRLRIVCSTETLVYGINSNVDVVIIPSMLKTRTDGMTKATFLYPNEYMNYAGRAGRLDIDNINEKKKKLGYIYPILNANYQKADEVRKETDQKLQWERLKRDIQIPQRIFSRYFSLELGQQAFYLLSLFPNGRDAALKNTIIKDELEEQLNHIPRDKAKNHGDNLDILQPLSELLDRKLIYIKNDYRDKDENFVPEYALTDEGSGLTGYIISLEEYDALMRAAYQCITAEKMYKVDLLHAIVCSREILHEANERVGLLSDFYPKELENSVNSMTGFVERWRSQMSNALYHKIKESLRRFREDIKFREHKRLSKNRNFINYRLVFALLVWIDEDFTIKQLFDAFAVSYMQIMRFAEVVSYRLDILSLALPVASMDGACTLYKKLGSTRIQEARDWVKSISDELFYRIPVHICRFLDIKCYDPYIALKLREVGAIYKELDILLDQECELSPKQKNRLSHICEKIRGWNPDWQKAFYEKFGGVLNEADRNI